jgi:hypothetical protein
MERDLELICGRPHKLVKYLEELFESPHVSTTIKSTYHIFSRQMEVVLELIYGRPHKLVRDLEEVVIESPLVSSTVK